MKITKLLPLALLSLLLPVSCDQVDFEDRLEGPVLAQTGKNVLVEDFTGQKCPNCPLAQVEVEKLQEAYGARRVIAVALHGGAQALGEQESEFLGLANEESKEYNRRLGKFAYPKGLVDRQGGLLDFEKWNAAVVSRMSVAAKVRLDLRQIAVDPDTRQLSFSCEAGGLQSIEGQVQLWLTESNIVALQYLPRVWGGGHREDYVHHHVFRAAVNGLDGEHLSLDKGERWTKEYTFKLRDDWKPENMALVMICSSPAGGVVQVIDAPLISKE